MTAGHDVAPLGEMMLGIIRSYPPALRRWVDVAAVTRVFSRELMVVLEEAAVGGDDAAGAWDQLVALPLVERRANQTYAVHETVRGPLLADLRQRDRDLIVQVASTAGEYFADRAGASGEAWSVDLLEVVYYGLLTEPDIAMDEVDALLEEPVVRWHPARRSAIVAVVLELLDAELLGGDVARTARALQLEDLLVAEQPSQVVRVAATELHADADMPVESDLDARIANALGLAHVQLARPDLALSLYRRSALSGGLWGAEARLREADVHADADDDRAAEEAYLAALEQVVEYGMAEIVDARASGSVRVGTVAAWTVPFPVDGPEPDTAEQADEPVIINMIFVEGDRAADTDADADEVDLVTLPDGRVGALAEPLDGFGIVWLKLAELYVRTGRLDEARYAAELGSRLAEVAADNDTASAAFNLLARIGAQRGDREFARSAISADRELAAFVMQTGGPQERLQAALRLGWSEVADGHLARATEAFETARADADDLADRIALASALLGLAEVATQDQRTDDAVSTLQAAMAEYELQGDLTAFAEARHRLGDLLVEAGRPEPAVEALEAVRRFYDDRAKIEAQARARVSLARAAGVAGDYSGADEQFDAARSLAAQGSDARVRVSVELGAGDLLLDRFEFGAAVERYRAALAYAGSVHPDLRAACHLRLGAAELSHDRRRAVHEFEQAAQVFGQIDDVADEIRARGQQATALSWLRDDAAVALAEQIVETLPDALDRNTRAGAYVDLATVFERLDRHGDALAVLSPSAVAELGIDAATARLELLAAVGRFAEVLDEIGPIVEREPYRADLHALRGWCLLGLDTPRFADAEACYLRARSLEPDNPWHQKDLAHCLMGLGRGDEAATLGRGVVDRLVRPGIAQLPGDLLSLAGFAAYLAGDHERAADCLATAVRDDPQYTVADLDLALVELCTDAPDVEDHYARLIERLTTFDADRRRGVLAVAVRDVEDALSWRRVPDRPAAHRILDRMQEVRDGG